MKSAQASGSWRFRSRPRRIFPEKDTDAKKSKKQNKYWFKVQKMGHCNTTSLFGGCLTLSIVEVIPRKCCVLHNGFFCSIPSAGDGFLPKAEDARPWIQSSVLCIRQAYH